MSDEGGVTFSEVFYKSTLSWVTPVAGKGALGTRRFWVNGEAVVR